MLLTDSQMLLKVCLLLMNGSCDVATAINYFNHFSDETDVADADADGERDGDGDHAADNGGWRCQCRC